MDTYRVGPLTFDVRDGGPADGEPVVLLHGFPQNNTAWATVEPVLHAAGYRTLAPNQRGYSPGARPKGRRAYRWDALMDDVVALLDAAGLESAHVVGHDLGAAVGWMLASRNPERVRTLTILSVPHPGAMARSIRNSTQGLKSWYIGVFQLPAFPEFVLARGGMARTLAAAKLPSEVRRGYAEHFRQPGALTAAINWYRALPFGTDEPLHRCALPTTFIWGRNDAFLGRAGAEATANYVTGDYRFVDFDGDHWLPDKHGPEMAEFIIERVESGRAEPASTAGGPADR